MVSYVSTASGRRQAAGCGLLVALAGGAALVAWKLADQSGWLAWVGWGLLALGAAGVGWAVLHPTRSGLPALPRSEACRRGRHHECSGPGPRHGAVECGCECHQEIWRTGD
jgi:hypothetical protein